MGEKVKKRGVRGDVSGDRRGGKETVRGGESSGIVMGDEREGMESHAVRGGCRRGVEREVRR